MKVSPYLLVYSGEMIGEYLKTLRIHKGLTSKSIICNQLAVFNINNVETGEIYSIDTFLNIYMAQCPHNSFRVIFALI